jgi:hypothetical protein
MALIDTTTLLGIADRAAEQYDKLQDAFGEASQTGGGTYFDRVTSTNDSDIEVPTVGPYKEVDDDIDVDVAIRSGTMMANIIGAMEAHFNTRDSAGNPLQPGGWDGYAISQDVRYSWWFNRFYYAIKSHLMLAINIFSESDDVFGTVEIVAGPGVNFADGVNYGNGAATNLANGDNYAATQFKVVVQTFGATQLDLRLSVKDINDIPTTIDVSIPGGSAPGTEISVGTTSDRFLDVIGASFVPLGSNGTLGDTVTVQNLKERQIAL